MTDRKGGRARTGDEALEPVTGGFRGRFRYGKGQRTRVVIRMTDRAKAEARARDMRALAALLTQGGHSDQAPLMLAKAAEADEPTFRKLQTLAATLLVVAESADPGEDGTEQERDGQP